MHRLALLVGDMLRAQEHQQRLHQCLRAWMPLGGWMPGGATLREYQFALDTQRGEIVRCTRMFGLAANEPTAPEAA